MEWIFIPEAWIALVTLTSLEIVLGIDNIVFLSILTGRLPQSKQKSARKLGLAFAMLTRLALLFSLAWIVRLTNPLFTLAGNEISARDVILIAGGLFLIAKSTFEIHGKIEGEAGPEYSGRVGVSYWGVIIQIAIIDIIFSLDSVITAVGMAQHVGVMATAIVIAVLIMMVFAEAVSRFIEQHPTIKILALSFLLLIGTALVADGLDLHIPKGYIYFAMAYALAVEVLNIRYRRSRTIKANAA